MRVNLRDTRKRDDRRASSRPPPVLGKRPLRGGPNVNYCPFERFLAQACQKAALFQTNRSSKSK